MRREIIHVDVTAFAVAVERVVHPELRGRPVVVAPVGPSRSVVTALSQEAWESGVRKGMVLAKAVRYCRNVVVVPPNEPLYGRASRAVLKLLEAFSPVIEPSGYGHVFLDVSGTDRLFGPARDAAWKAQKEIRDRLRLETTLGVASNKLVSRIASAVVKPVGLRDVPLGGESAFLAPLSVGLIPGVGPGIEERLGELNIRFVRDLVQVGVDPLILAFGRLGFTLHQRALGIDTAPVSPLRVTPAIDEEKILAEDSNDYRLLQASVSELCERGGECLRAAQQRAGRMELRIRYSDYREAAGQAKLHPLQQSSAALCREGGVLLGRLLTRRTRVRRLQLRLADLTRGPVQRGLFPEPGLVREARLESALDRLRQRFGAQTIGRLRTTLPAKGPPAGP